MYGGLRLTALGLLALAGLAVEGWALAGGPDAEEKEEIVVTESDGQGMIWVASDDEKGAVVENRIVIRRDGDEGPFEIVTLGEAGEKGAYLGVSTREETKLSEGGARITRVYPDTPADRAGLEEGDIIVAANGKPIRGSAMLTETIHAGKPGDRIDFEVVRDGSRTTVTAELGERKGMRIVMPRFGSESWGDLSPEERARVEEEIARAREEAQRALESLRIEIPELKGHAQDLRWRALSLSAGRPKLGVELVDTTAELREHMGGRSDAGVLVGKVLKDSAAEKAGVLVGDLLVSVDGEPVSRPADVIRAVGENAGKTVELEVVRDGRVQTLTVTLPEDDPGEHSVRPRARFLAPHAPPAPPAAPAVAPPPPPSPTERRMV